MYSRIFVPVDLGHKEGLSKAVDTALGLARDHGARLVFAGVTPTTPTSVAHSPEEFDRKLKYFADEKAGDGVAAEALTLKSNDPSVDLDRVLLDAIETDGADLVVMASHVPGPGDYLFHGHASHVATHAKVSVFVVR